MTLIEKVEHLRDVRNHAMNLCDQTTAKLVAYAENPTDELREEAIRTCQFLQNFCRVLSGATIDARLSL